MPRVSFDAWREFIAQQPNPHLLQTAEWGELKRAFGWQVERLISGDWGVQILFRRLPLGFTVAYAPRPVFSHQSSANSEQVSGEGQRWELFLREIDAVCREKRAVFLKIEPDCWGDHPSLSFAPSAFIVSKHNIQPPRTIVVSLEGTEEDLLARMKQKTRYNVRLAEKKGVTVRAWDDLDGFHRMMTITGGRDGFGVHSAEYYRKAYALFHPAGMAELLLAEYEGRPLAALMVFAVGRRAYYLYGASTDEERNRMPTYLLQWRAMQWAKARNCTEYDLWGVPDEDEATLEAQFETRQDGLWGVYRFKRGFGGQVRRAAQALDRVYLPFLYRFYAWKFKA
ncbi:MAG: peptidoglycan bridge formation glycyltransferase FemA/FemB family protein [Anaerolineales bacterium]|nr:peptidoglycan bridge formation glycyltransferase FemA/FemB family protein [Anaerolineales bacterium]MCX7754066.1 peptidoglycan bridge formation glycyltransferase FemA/FemB family protein [Anaerolineales bacterium]